MKGLRSSPTLIALVAGCANAESKRTRSFIKKSDLPGSDKWMSLQPDVEFLPGRAMATEGDSADSNAHADADDGLETALRRQMRALSSSTEFSPYSAQPFVEGNSEYDENQQAWRYLGFMIDCDAGNYDDDGSWDGGTGEGCERYLMWAAYVDLEYEGGGIGEYQYWDRETEEWDSTSCNYGGTNRCAKMDCHEDDTHWSLLGLFKHRSYDDWMEQLFKHEGYCVWDSDDYNFMSNTRKAWPGGCSDSGSTTSDGNELYYDLKPTSGGDMRIGLYTDTKCITEYTGDITVEDVLGNILLEGGSGDGSGDNGDKDYSGYSLDDSYAEWDSIFDTWKICHPCVAYDLNNVGYNVDDDASRGSMYNKYKYGYDDDYNYAGGYEQSDFDCYDDADYTNVNQCMKFMAKTAMNTATFRDLSLASSQGTLVESVPVAGISKKQEPKHLKKGVTLFFLFSSFTVLAAGIFMYYTTQKEIKQMPKFTLREPLNPIT